jgi:hypothetical protein
MNQVLLYFSRNRVTPRLRVAPGVRKKHPTWYRPFSTSPVRVLGVVGVEALVGSARSTRSCTQCQSNETEQARTANENGRFLSATKPSLSQAQPRTLRLLLLVLVLVCALALVVRALHPRPLPRAPRASHRAPTPPTPVPPTAFATDHTRNSIPTTRPAVHIIDASSPPPPSVLLAVHLRSSPTRNRLLKLSIAQFRVRNQNRPWHSVITLTKNYTLRTPRGAAGSTLDVLLYLFFQKSCG